MANLIITVISIALVAVAALMGAYYGGTAFMDGQTKATANTLVQQANQIKAAYILYLADGGTPLPNERAIDGTDDFLQHDKILVPGSSVAQIDLHICLLGPSDRRQPYFYFCGFLSIASQCKTL